MSTTLSSKDAYSLMLKDYPDVMNIDQMCEILGVSTKTGYKLVREGRIDSLKIGRNLFVPKEYLISYLLIRDENNVR